MATMPNADRMGEVVVKLLEQVQKDLGAEAIGKNSRVADVLLMVFEDLGQKYYFGLSPEGNINFTGSEITGRKTLEITTTLVTFHQMAMGELNPMIAWAKRKVKFKGVPMLELRGFDDFVAALFSCYRKVISGA